MKLGVALLIDSVNCEHVFLDVDPHEVPPMNDSQAQGWSAGKLILRAQCLRILDLTAENPRRKQNEARIQEWKRTNGHW